MLPCVKPAYKKQICNFYSNRSGKKMSIQTPQLIKGPFLISCQVIQLFFVCMHLIPATHHAPLLLFPKADFSFLLLTRELQTL